MSGSCRVIRGSWQVSCLSPDGMPGRVWRDTREEGYAVSCQAFLPVAVAQDRRHPPLAPLLSFVVPASLSSSSVSALTAHFCLRQRWCPVRALKWPLSASFLLSARDLTKFSPLLCTNQNLTLPWLVSVLCWEGLLKDSETPKSWHHSLPSLLRFLEVLQTRPLFDPSPQKFLAPSEDNDK